MTMIPQSAAAWIATNAVIYATEEVAKEYARRWNAHIDLVKHLDGLLVQLEDTGDALDATIIEARQMLEAHGYDDKALGKLIDENP